MRGWRQTLLVLGLVGISTGIILVMAAAQTTLLVADRELSNSWRTSYDILVRPTGSHSPIEEKYGLVEANHLSGLWGGISFEQYEAIKSIPEIEVAAPIATLGYTPHFISTSSFRQLPEPGLYIIMQRMITDDGVSHYVKEYYADRFLYDDDTAPSYLWLYGGFFEYTPGAEVSGILPLDFLLAGIDPEQEAALIGLDQALVQGKYLRANKSLPSYKFTSSQSFLSLPVLFNEKLYAHLTLQTELRRITTPWDDAGLEEILKNGKWIELYSLPVETLERQEISGEDLYRQLIKESQVGMTSIGVATSSPGPILYREIEHCAFCPGLALEIVLPGGAAPNAAPELAYRPFLDPNNVETRFNFDLMLQTEGIFDIEKLPEPADVNRVPLETYFPPIATLRYDEQGNRVDPPRELRPTLNPTGYIQPPPMILTTLEAARALRGDNAISAIRVRVVMDRCSTEQPETCILTDADQRKIETIALEIQRQTGLDVDIMAGSSPTRVLVHVSGIGYVEEQWIQKGVNLVYKQGIQTGNWLLLGTLLLAGMAFTLDLTWSGVLAHRRIIALQKALGWRSRTVFAQVIGQTMIIGTITSVIGGLIAFTLIRFLGWQSLPLEWWATLPTLVIALCIEGSLFPAWSASRMPPVIEIQRGTVQYNRKGIEVISSLLMYAWHELKRKPTRSILTAIASTLSAGLLVLFLGVTLQQRGVLSGTLLGEFILVRIKDFHYGIVTIGFGLAAFSTFNLLMTSILERRREIGILKAIGWRTAAVAWLFVLEGLMIGMVGGSVGALAGSFAFVYLYQSISSDLILAILLGTSVPGLVGALAAVYPALLARHVPPAEAVRYE
jgi:hypothetical protein